MNRVPMILLEDTEFQKKWKSYSVWDETCIKGFFGDFRFLSNFHMSDTYYKGILFPSVEHAYQFAKVPLPYWDIPISYADWRFTAQSILTMSAAEVKKWGQTTTIRQDWEEVKYDIMLSCVFSKFYETIELRNLLLSTENTYLAEINHWGDLYWGVDYKTLTGQNNLGKILMKVREVFKNV